jgi:hypothetical protein
MTFACNTQRDQECLQQWKLMLKQQKTVAEQQAVEQ